MRLKEGPEMNKKHLWLAGACLLAVGGCSNDSSRRQLTHQKTVEHQMKHQKKQKFIEMIITMSIVKIQIRLTMYIHSKLLIMSTQLTLLTGF